MYELVFTSAKAGLIPGRSGFCSVAWTNGIPQNLITLLENMSGYNALYAPDDPRAKDNPVCYSYQKVQFGRSQLRILSRIAFAGLDHTGRSNKIAHHIVLDEKDDKTEIMRMKHGPVSVFLNEKNFYTSWNEPPRLLDQRKSLYIEESTGLKAEKWETFAKDSRWAGYIADVFSRSNDKNSCFYVEYDNEFHGSRNILLLIDEITRLMRPAEAQEFTFNTCFSSAQTGCSCFLRAALPTCTALPAIRKFRSSELISLINTAAFPDIPESVNIIRAAGREFTPESKPLTMPNIKVPKKGGTPPPPAPDQVIDLAQTISANTVIETSSKRRLLVFFIAAGGIFVLIAVLVFFMVTSGAEKEKLPEPKVEVDKVVPAPAVETKEIVQPLEEEKKVPEKTEKKEEKKPEVKNPPVKKSSVKKVDKPKAKPKPPVVLSDKEQYKLYYAFVSKKSEIPLPVSLHGAEKVIIELKSEWGKPLGAIADADLAKCMDKKNKKVTVFAVKEDENYLIVADKTNSNMMTAVLNDKSLNISDGKNFEEPRYPDRFNLKSIVIVKDGQKISLPLEFKHEFAKYVPRGKFDDSLKYEPSAEEKFFKEHFNEIKARDDYSSKLEKWNERISDIVKLVKKIAALKKDKNNKAVKFDEFTQKYKDCIAMLDKRDFEGAKKAFLTFLSLCDKVSNEDMEKFILKCGKGQTDFSNFITDLHKDLDSLIRAEGPKDLDSVPYKKVQDKIIARGKIVKGATIGEVEEELEKLKTKLAKDGPGFLGIRKEDFAAVKMDKELTKADFANLLNKNIGYYAKREVKHGKNK